MSKKVPPQEQAREWKKGIRAQRRGLDRQMAKIEREENTIKVRVKTLIRQGQGDAVLPLIRGLAESKKARGQLLKTGMQLDSLVRQIDLQIAQLKITGAFQASAEVTHMLNQMVRLPEMQATMQQFAQEMQVAGMACEMMDDAMGEIADEVDPEDQDLAVRLIYNEMAADIARSSGKEIPLMPVSAAEVAADPKAAALARPG